MNALPILGALGFLLVASVIAGLYRLSNIDTEPFIQFSFTPNPVDLAIEEDELVAALDDLYYGPAFGEVRS